MLRFWRQCCVFITLSIYFSMAPFGYAIFAVISLLPTRRPLQRARLLQTIMHRAFRLMHDWLRFIGLLNFNPRATLGQKYDKPCVLVANHLTLTDVTSVVASAGPITTVVRTDIYNQRWLTPLLRSAAFFPGPLETYGEVAMTIDAAVDRLKNGFQVLFFPEGTRSTDGETRPFGRIAFEVACRADVPVVPIAIRCAPLWLSKDAGILQPRLNTPQMQLKFLPPVFPKDHGYCSRTLRAVVEGAVKAELQNALPQDSKEAHDRISGRTIEASHR